MNSDRELKAGEIFRVKFPFTRCEVDVADADPEGAGYATIQSWKPGVEFIDKGYPGDDTEAVCDGEGEMVLSVVGTFKPGRFPTRVFYTRTWVTPEGKVFGKGGLHVITAPAFKRRAKRYMHEYTVRASTIATEATGKDVP